MALMKGRRTELSGRAGRPDGVIYRQQFVRCGKERCRKCVPGGLGHGPYWFGYYWDYRQHTKSFYVGKQLPAGVEAIVDGQDAQPTRHASDSAHTSRPH